MEDDATYGEKIKKLLKNVSEKEIISLALATAKKESWYNPIWNLSLTRYENWHKTFSYSYFHILMEWAWNKSIKKLNFTKWEIMYPKNAMKLFLWFLIEKMSTKLKNYFPIEKHWVSYAKSYNWSNVNLRNYLYDDNNGIIKHYNVSLKFLNSKSDWKVTPIALETKNQNNRYLVNKKSWVDKIRTLQKAMKKLWFLQVRDTGIYGPKTIQSIITFQKKLGVETTGLYDLNTIKAVTKIQKNVFKFTNNSIYWKLWSRTIRKLKEYIKV